MTRFITFSLAVVTTSCVTLMIVKLALDTTTDLHQVFVHDRMLGEKLTSYRCFKYVLESTVESLRTGRMPLKEAQARVHDAAREYHPDFLVYLAFAERPGTTEQRIARNLVGHALGEHAYQPAGSASLPMLEEELDELLALAR